MYPAFERVSSPSNVIHWGIYWPLVFEDILFPVLPSTEVDSVLRFLTEQCGAKHIGAVATHYLALQYPQIKAAVSVYGRSVKSLHSASHVHKGAVSCCTFAS